MKYRGIVYDAGLNFSGKLSVETFNPSLVEYDMSTIANSLRANAIRIEGEEISRLVTATRLAHAVGLTVFFNPWKMGADIEETRAYLEEAAQAAEELRKQGVDIIFVAGCEYTIFSQGVFPGESFTDRTTWLAAQLSAPDASLHQEHLPESIQEKSHKLNQVLRSFVERIRRWFHGTLTYSAGSWEAVDWSMFDMVGLDYYRRGEPEEEYVAGLDIHKKHGKPTVVLEVGCCAYEGAAQRGDGGFILLKGTNPDGTGIFADDVVPTRSESQQADYIGTQLELLSGAGVHGVFIYVFSFPCMLAGEGASDLDMMSFSLVKTLPERDLTSKVMPPWVPKEAFYRIAEYYKRLLKSV